MIEWLIIGWGMLTVFVVTMTSITYVDNRIANGRWNTAFAVFYTFVLYAGTLFAHVALGAAANTVGERHGAYIYYGDSGMGAGIYFLLEVLWCALVWAFITITSLFGVWRRKS